MNQASKCYRCGKLEKDDCNLAKGCFYKDNECKACRSIATSGDCDAVMCNYEGG